MEEYQKIIVNDDILLYALRYSLIRETSAPVQTMDAIVKNIDNISQANIEKMIREIETSTGVGFLMYEKSWKGLVKDLKLELKIRAAKLQ